MPAIVFLHAFPLSGAMWRPQVEVLPPGWMAVVPDVRGFGEAGAEADVSAALSQVSLDDYAADVLASLDELGIAQAVFCGCSMGGYVALAVLRNHPARVAGLVLADTRVTADTDAGLEGRRSMIDLLDREGPAAVVSQMVPKLVGGTTAATRPAVVRTVEELAARATAHGIRAAVARMMNRPDSSAVLAACTAPVLIVVGAEDQLTPVADARAMAALATSARLAVIPAAGHLANLEMPDAFNAALAAFLPVCASGPEAPADA